MTLSIVCRRELPGQQVITASEYTQRRLPVQGKKKTFREEKDLVKKTKGTDRVDPGIKNQGSGEIPNPAPQAVLHFRLDVNRAKKNKNKKESEGAQHYGEKYSSFYSLRGETGTNE